MVFATACAIFKFIYADAQNVAEQLARHFHLELAGHYPRIFLEIARLLALGFGALGYSALRWAEAYGLRYGKRWAWIIGMISVGVYIPIEIFELVKRANWAEVALFLLSVLILMVLLRGRPR